MAEAIGAVSGVSALVTATLQGSIILLNTIKSYKGHQTRVLDFLDGLVALTQVLSKLDETIKAVRDVDFSMLEIPLQQCDHTCKALHEELLKCLSRSNDTHTSFRDWLRLKYMGEDIDGIRRLLAEHKMTIQIALADAHLRESSATVERIEIYTDLLNTTKANLQDRLERIDEKMDRIIVQKKGGSEKDAHEVKLIEEERLSTEKCLQICTQLSDHISQIQLTAKRSTGPNGPLGSSSLPQKVADEGFQGCVDSLSRATSKLEEHERQLFDRLIEKSKTALFSEDDRTDIARLRDEWLTTRHHLNIWSTAQSHLRDKVSTIENYAKGDAIQIMASTGEKTIHGKNQGLGAKTGQVGGYMSNDTIQQSLRMMGGIFGQTTRLDDTYLERENSIGAVNGTAEGTGSSFKGKGFQLASTPSSCNQTMLTRSARDESRS
ncbi:uncharacterized protein Z518_01518 [Rhinocladiella mackenziei CBS 650.93]|uniref:Azaphilone pigments biosynthesis cluster protein L N-terminal domain-containing protein n=1 Tax=Rhinocladiella mackenziei CBS 650.93 TaxID=1442369 RepID=A0A0D2J3Z8_9EURO|nr:uncharacterized protein Z518_01518 [Rhinocladiella mackenziei CBS 650.93]KIX10436.1 hypothetical protein Z518_01518 [Rhinocladiella mackenziei CBS 650.93]